MQRAGAANTDPLLSLKRLDAPQHTLSMPLPTEELCVSTHSQTEHWGRSNLIGAVSPSYVHHAMRTDTSLRGGL